MKVVQELGTALPIDQVYLPQRDWIPTDNQLAGSIMHRANSIGSSFLARDVRNCLIFQYLSDWNGQYAMSPYLDNQINAGFITCGRTKAHLSKCLRE